MPLNRLAVGFAIAAFALSGCVAQHRGEPRMWFASHDAVPPRAGGGAAGREARPVSKVSVCHGFGCHRKTSVALGPSDIATMRRLMGPARTPRQERRGVRRLIAWAERRVAPEVGSAGDVGGLDLFNAGKRGQMDCIDEATNTTSYLMVAAAHGLIRHHEVGRPVARGFFLDGRYPHATAVLVDEDGEPWAVDSWPDDNGSPPQVMPLPTWFERSPAR